METRTRASAAASRPDGQAGCRPECPLNTAAAIIVRGRLFHDLEREIYVLALRENGGSRRRAAQALGISRSTFCDRVRRLGVPR
jgi:DNA-binding NtrC family response regulator